MKRFASLLFISSHFSFTPISAQTFTFSAGPNYGRFYDFTRNEGHHQKDYSNQIGYRMNLTVSDLKLDSVFSLKFSLGTEQYGGDFYASDGGLGGNISDRGNLKKQVLWMEICPLNAELLPHLFLSAGIGGTMKLRQQLTGYRSEWEMSSPPMPDTQLSTINGFVSEINFGITGNISYAFHIGQLRIIPIYGYFLGLNQEFRHLQSPAKSHRHCLQLGIGYHF